MPLNTLVNIIARFKKQAIYAQLNRYKQDPKTIQLKILMQIIRENQQTVFGKEHQFSAIRSWEDFKRNVPIRNSKLYADYLGRAYQGEENVITREKPYFFAMTTGSTGVHKYIPITKKLRRETDNSMLAFIHLIEQHFPETRLSPIQFLVGSGDGGHSPGGVPQGFVSGFNYKNLPSAITRRFVIPYWVFTMEDAHDRFYAIARFMIDSDGLVAIAAISPLIIANVAKSTLANIERLISDLSHQKLTLSAKNQHLADKYVFALKPAKLAALKAYRPDVDPPVKLISALFDRVQYLVTWAGGNMSYSMTEVEHYFGQKQLFEMPFSASEGTFSIPCAPNARGGIAGVTGHFLEYIPEDQIEQENPQALGAWEVEEGKTYYQVITTSGGLYRYNMEDLIKVTGFWGKVPIVEFLSKLARQVSISNERLTEKDVTDTVNNVCIRLGVHFDHFIFFPSRRGFYWLVVGQELADMGRFLREAEAELLHNAKGYHYERGNLCLQPIRMMVVDKEAMAQHIHGHQFKSNLPSGQYKPLHLSNVFEGHEIFESKKEYIIEGIVNEHAI